MEHSPTETDVSVPMVESDSDLTGHCLCGAVSITVTGGCDPRVGACHCRMCQRWTGGLFLCFTTDASSVSVNGEVSRYRSSAFAERAFCPKCGSHLWFNDVREAGAVESYELMPGLFDGALQWPLRSEIYVDRAMASVQLSGDHRRKSRAEYEAENPFVEGDVSCASEGRLYCGTAKNISSPRRSNRREARLF